MGILRQKKKGTVVGHGLCIKQELFMDNLLTYLFM